MAGDGFDAGDAFGAGYVGQGGAGYDVTDGIDARYVGAVVLVNVDQTLIGVDTQVFEADVFGIRSYAGGGEYYVALYGLLPSPSYDFWRLP